MDLPLLIDTDMGADDALAIALALSASACRPEALVAVAGNVDLDQAVTNIGRLLQAIDPPHRPVVGKGLEQDDRDLADARHVFGDDGLGQTDLPACQKLQVKPHRQIYRELLRRHRGRLHIVAIGPLTNVADMLSSDPDLLSGAGRLTIMGGAIWTGGNVAGVAEFNFYRDPAAAQQVLSAGLSTTLVPLDVTRQVVFDESHLARLGASGTRAGSFLAKVLSYAMQNGAELSAGRMLVHDALAVGSILWPELFLKTRLHLEIEVTGKSRGRCRPTVGAKAGQVDVLTAVDAPGFLERLLEQLCQESFVV